MDGSDDGVGFTHKLEMCLNDRETVQNVMIFVIGSRVALYRARIGRERDMFRQIRKEGKKVEDEIKYINVA